MEFARAMILNCQLEIPMAEENDSAMDVNVKEPRWLIWELQVSEKLAR